MRKLVALVVVLVALTSVPPSASAQPSIVWADIPDDWPVYLADASARMFCTDYLLEGVGTVCEIAVDPALFGWPSS